MKRLFNTNFNNEGVHFMLLLLRVATVAFLLTHGYPKLQMLINGGAAQFGDPIGVGPVASLYLTVFAEVFCSILLLLGLASRLALIPLITVMLVAIFIVHAPDAFGVKELAAHYLVTFVFLLVCGPGKYSIDSFISRNSSKRRR